MIFPDCLNSIFTVQNFWKSLLSVGLKKTWDMEGREQSVKNTEIVKDGSFVKI